MDFNEIISSLKTIYHFSTKGAGISACLYTIVIMINKQMWNPEIVHFPAVFWIIYILVMSYIVLIPFFLINVIILTVIKFKVTTNFHYLMLFFLAFILSLLISYFIMGFKKTSFNSTDTESIWVLIPCTICGLGNTIAGFLVVSKLN